MDNCAIYLLDSSKELVRLGDCGEIYVAGYNLCSGYLKNREMDRFLPNFLENKPGKIAFLISIVYRPALTKCF